jgi:hypothetical protein
MATRRIGKLVSSKHCAIGTIVGRRTLSAEMAKCIFARGWIKKWKSMVFLEEWNASERAGHDIILALII